MDDVRSATVDAGLWAAETWSASNAVPATQLRPRRSRRRSGGRGRDRFMDGSLLRWNEPAAERMDVDFTGGR
jgi:hypothetical protein